MSAWPEITLGQHSRAGLKGINQDFHGAMLPGPGLRRAKGIVVALADGIGSSAVSQEASAAAVRSFLDDYYATSDAWSVRRSAQRVLGATNAWLHAQTLRSHARFDKDQGYVCTFSALIVKGRDVHLLHVGDARIYRLHGAALEQLTQDHRIHLSSAESYLARALGASPHVEIDYCCLAAEAGAVYVLATDGAYAHFSGLDLAQALALHAEDFDEAARYLVDQAFARGATDDMTVQIVRIDALPGSDRDSWPGQRASLMLPPPLAPGMQFEGYTVVRELHASARSQVHLAVDDLSGQPVAIKTPSLSLRDEASHLDRLLLEEWAATRLRSPHVLRPCPSDRPRQHLFVAMEFLDGQTLGQWMVDHPQPDLDAVRSLIAQVGRGLEAFHGKEMLHQDLRPENVMLDRAGTARIIDFGSVHVAGLEEGQRPVGDASIAGTLQYTAPEYFLGAQGTARSDLFSLAVLTYQMLTGQLPYGLQVVRVRSAADVRRLRYVSVRHLRPDLPPWLDGVLHKALHPDPAQRQEAVSEFLHDLVAPGPQFQRHRPIPLVQRNPVAFWQATTFVLGLAVLALLALRVLGR